MNFDRIRELLWEQTFHSSKLSSVLVMLEEVGKFISGRTPKSDELASIGDIPYFKVGDMNTEGNEKFLRITSLFLKEKAGKTFPAGAIVYPKNGGAVFTNKRRILATESVIDLNTGGLVCGEKLNQAYAYMFFCGLDFRKISKGTALPTIDQKKLHRTKIPVPSLEEQSSIVTRLEEAFAEIDRAEKAYEELQTLAGVLRGQILQEAIQGKLVPQLAEEGVVEHIGAAPEKVPFTIPESWKWTTLNAIGKWKAGGTPSRSIPEYYGGEIPWLKTGDLTDGLITSVEEYITRAGVENSSAHINPAGAVLIAMYGATIGKLGVLAMPCATNQACCACAVNEELVDKWYLFYYLLSQRTGFLQLGAGGAQPNISKTKIVNYPIPVPPIKEQSRIVAAIEKLLKQVDALSAR